MNKPRFRLKVVSVGYIIHNSDYIGNPCKTSNDCLQNHVKYYVCIPLDHNHFLNFFNKPNINQP